jgi:carboxypeptidase C (cathepsin A)
VTFLAWGNAAAASPTARPVCRFYGRPEAGLDSHFYSAFADECDAVRTKYSTSWQFEASDVFYIEVPDRVTGACPGGTDAVLRVYDNRRDANHRYMVSAVVRATMQARGWIPEGDGPDAVVMCTPRPKTGADDAALADPTSYSTTPTGALASAVDAAAVTYHTITLGGTTIPYQATTGHLVARDPANGQQASFFYVAYVAQGQDAATRPVTFFYNGGPGSASIWLHLGSFGPKRLATGVPSTSLSRPFALVDNNESMLDISDLVFVDAIGTGLSQAIAPANNQTFWSVDKDAAAFRNFIQRYVEVKGRAASPKFLFGESYGTTRTAVLANLLELAGTSLTGIVLQSSVLNYGSNCAVVDAPISCAGYLPTYAATAAYYRLVVPPPVDLPGFHTQVESFSVATYAPAVDTYIVTRLLPDAGVLETLRNDTGIPLTGWQANLNLAPGPFQVQLIPGTLIGRYDTRIFAPADSPLASQGDPSDTLVSDSFGNAIYGYLRDELKYSWPNAYVGVSNAIYSWDFSHDGYALPDAVPDLAAAMTLNPRLKVLSVNGYHDLATPYFQTALDLARIGFSAVQLRNYDGGHMTYLDDTSRPLQKGDLRAFYRSLTIAH